MRLASEVFDSDTMIGRVDFRPSGRRICYCKHLSPMKEMRTCSGPI